MVKIAAKAKNAHKAKQTPALTNDDKPSSLSSMAKMTKTPTKRVMHSGKEVAITHTAPRLTTTQAEEIYTLTTKGLNESEACAILGIDRQRWFNWKSINKSRCEDIFTRIRGNRLQNLIGQIEAAAEGDATRGIRHDWRAADRLLAISAPERFAKSAESATATPQQALAVEVVSHLVRLAYPAPQPLALPAPTTTANDASIDVEATASNNDHNGPK